MRTKTICTLLLLMLSYLTASASEQAYLYANGPIQIKAGERISLAIALKNTVGVLGWQTHMYLPTGISAYKELNEDEELDYVISLTSRKKSRHSLTAEPTTSGAIQLVAEATNGTSTFNGNDGDIATIDIVASNDIAPGTYSIILKEIAITDADMETHYQDDYSISIVVPAPPRNVTAVSADEKMGSVELTGVTDGSVQSGATVTAKATAMEGYEFVKWSDGSTENPYSFTVNNDVALTASFQPKKYDVVFDVDGVNTTSELEFGAVIAKPENPTKTGYTFTGWNPAFVEGVTVPVGGATYTATWQVNQYTITFNTDGGNAIDPITADYGSSVTAPAVPTKTGYTFTGWDKEIPSAISAENITITAQWQINQYTISFNTDGGNAIDPITGDYGSSVTAPAAPTKTGYTFTGWDKEVPSTLTEDITVTAQWQVNKYTITFNTDGGSAIDPITADYDSSVTAPAAPTKTGYTFTGWDKEVPSTMPAENVTVKALWTVNKYNVKFVVDGVAVYDESMDYGATITAPENPEKEGFTFTGWSPEVSATVPTSDVTYTAQFTINSYDLKYVVDGETYKTVSATYGAAITPEAAPVKEGYTFSGWSEIPSTMPANDVTVTGSFTVNSYTITFDTDGGNEIPAITQDYGTSVTKPADPTKTGYTFTGWDKAVPATMPAGDLTIKALWTVNQYTITFNTDGGSAIDPITGDYGSSVTVPAAPTKTGYTFTGWDKEIPSTLTENMTITAQWQINQYTITFNTDGGSAIDPITADYGSSLTVPVAPTKAGHTFTGWDKEIPSTLTEDMTITAQWQINQYTITFNTNGGSAINPITGDYGSSVTDPAAPTKTGYTFTGWDKEIPSTLTEDITVTAQWQINKYKVTFIADGATLKEDELEYGSQITAPTAPEKEGYTFSGWDPSLAETVPANDVTYTAKYMLQPYYLIYLVDGEEYQRIAFEYGSNTSVLESPTKTGYTFSGWSEVPEIMPANDVTITGSFSINQYTIMFNTDGGSAIDPITADYGTSVTAPANPTKTGYTFTGWDKSIPTTMPAENITINAQWKINQYTITFLTEGGTAIAPIVGDYGTAVTAPANPTKTGYTFAGWDKAVPTTFTEDVTVIAKWTINQYKVTFVADGKTISENTLDYGTTVIPPSAPSKEGYTFTGWSPAVSGTVPANDVTYTAVYDENVYYISYMVDGELYQRTSYKYGENVSSIGTPTKEGYTFTGWNNVPAVMPAQDVIVTGTFTANKYHVYADIDGKSVDLGEMTYGDPIVLPTVEEREGYTWVWDSSNPVTVQAGAFTLKGAYIANKYKITYILDGEKVGEKEVEYGASMPTFEYSPSNPDITINKWYSDAEYTTMPAKDVVYYADFTNGIRNVGINAKVDVYTINGTKVKSNVTLNETKHLLPAGVYVINGKKMVIK